MGTASTQRSRMKRGVNSVTPNKSARLQKSPISGQRTVLANAIIPKHVLQPKGNTAVGFCYSFTLFTFQWWDSSQNLGAKFGLVVWVFFSFIGSKADLICLASSALPIWGHKIIWHLRIGMRDHFFIAVLDLNLLIWYYVVLEVPYKGYGKVP